MDFGPSENVGGQDQSGLHTVHVIGFGNIGMFVVHSLLSMQRPPKVNIIFKSGEVHRSVIGKARGITLISKAEGAGIERSGFTSEVMTEEEQQADFFSARPHSPKEPKDEHIPFLIVTLKAHQVMSAIRAIQYRLDKRSTICFLHNGVGVLDEINSTVFKDPEERPVYIAGIVTHGITREWQDRLKIFQRGTGSITLATLPQDCPSDIPVYGNSVLERTSIRTASDYMVRTMTGCKPLSATLVDYSEFLMLRFEKLSVNCIVNPLTAIKNCSNGELLNDGPTVHLMRLLLEEISQVIRSLPELKHVSEAKNRFAPYNLERLVRSIADKTATNISSMCFDFRNGHGPGEIGYLNGYIVRRGRHLGIDCSANNTIVRMIYETALSQSPRTENKTKV